MDGVFYLRNYKRQVKGGRSAQRNVVDVDREQHPVIKPVVMGD